MKNQTFTLIGILFFLVSACSSMKVISDYDNAANFNQYKTFGFSEQSNQLPVDDLIKKRIISSITSNLNRKGLTESATPDLLIDLAITTKNKKSYSNTNVNLNTVWGKKWRFRTGVGKTFSKEHNYTEGTLIINIIDKAEDNLVWKGAGSNIVKQSNSQSEAITEGVNKILEGYPPK